MSRLLPDVGRAFGETWEASGEVSRECALIDIRNQPASEVRERIATAMHGGWNQDGGTWRFTRPSAIRDRLTAQRDAEAMKQWISVVESVDYKNEPDPDTSIALELFAHVPIGNGQVRQRLFNDKSVVFSTSPNRYQLAMPPQMIAALRRYISAFPSAPTEYRAVVRIGDEIKVVIADAEGNAWKRIREFRPQDPRSTDPPLKSVAFALPATAVDLGKRLRDVPPLRPDSIAKQLEQPTRYEPLDMGPGAILRAYARAEGRSIVWPLRDADFAAMGSQESSMGAVRALAAGRKVQSDSDWIVSQLADPVGDAERNVDRALIARYLPLSDYGTELPLDLLMAAGPARRNVVPWSRILDPGPLRSTQMVVPLDLMDIIGPELAKLAERRPIPLDSLPVAQASAILDFLDWNSEDSKTLADVESTEAKGLAFTVAQESEPVAGIPTSGQPTAVEALQRLNATEVARRVHNGASVTGYRSGVMQLLRIEFTAPGRTLDPIAVSSTRWDRSKWRTIAEFPAEFNAAYRAERERLRTKPDGF